MEFEEWFEQNSGRFHSGHFGDKEIAAAAWYAGQDDIRWRIDAATRRARMEIIATIEAIADNWHDEGYADEAGAASMIVEAIDSCIKRAVGLQHSSGEIESQLESCWKNLKDAQMDAAKNADGEAIALSERDRWKRMAEWWSARAQEELVRRVMLEISLTSDIAIRL